MKKDKKKVLISSVLKPINDTRLYEKFGGSLAKKETLQIHICGFKSEVPTDPNITFHPLFHFKRLSIKRFLSYWKYAILLLKVKPHIIICNTFELQLINSIYKILFGAEYYYNLEENYFRNIRYTTNFPTAVRFLLAHAVRLKERLLHPFVNHYFSAELCYLSEMPFIQNKATPILNKFVPTLPSVKRPNRGTKNHFIYSGTIAEQYGIFTIIFFIKSLHTINPDITLTIIGFCANEKTLTSVKETIKNHQYIQLIGGDERVNHQLILAQIQIADFGIICYKKNPSTDNCFPTKIYEYIHYQLPIINLTKNSWSNHNVLDSAVLEINTETENTSRKLEKIKSHHFYKNNASDDIYWESEEKKLFNVLRLD